LTLSAAPADVTQYLRTANNYARRRGMTEEEALAIVADAFVPAAKARMLPKPELLDRGINDMRVNRDATDA
jgi:hypothetical protein